MPTGKSLNAANLERLGAPHLAALLIETSRGNAAAQRRLRLALAGSAGAEQTIRAVARRLTSIAGATTWLNGQRIRPLAAELEAQHRAILDQVAPSEPREAFELLWRLAGCAEPVLARTDDSGGRLTATFDAAIRDLGPLAERARLSPEDLSARALHALTSERHGAWDTLIPTLAPNLGRSGLQSLRAALLTWQGLPAVGRTGPTGWASATPQRQGRASSFLLQIADALHDPDGYIAQFDSRARSMPTLAAAIARRLLAADRPADALAALDHVAPERREHAAIEYDQARIDTLTALGRAAEAHALRWQRFLATLEPAHLRAHLKSLPDLEAFDAEQRALDHAATADIHDALSFLLAWPDLHRAARLVLDRTASLDGDRYDILSPAADALDGRYPLAATLLRRAMIDFTLNNARSSRYRHAARHLLECRAAAPRIADFASHPDHPTFERTLRAAHNRKAAFWQDASG